MEQQIVGLCGTTVRGGAMDEKAVITSFFDLILKTPEYSDAVVVFIPENAPAIEASHLYSYVMDNARVCTMSEAPGQRPGVPKTNNTTRDMQYIFENALAMGNLRYAERILTYRSNPEEMCKKLESQLQAFAWEELPKASEMAEQRFKLHGKSGGQNDDLLISCLMVPYWASIWMRSDYPDYQPFKYYAENGYFKDFAPVSQSSYNTTQQHYLQNY